MKKIAFVVHSLDGKTVRTYRKFKSALQFSKKLVSQDGFCYFSQWNDLFCTLQTCILSREDFHK